MGNVLIFCKNPEDREFLFNACRQLGVVYTSPTLEKAETLLDTVVFSIVLVDADAADAPGLRERLSGLPALFLVGREEDRLRETVRAWPAETYVDSILVSNRPLDLNRTQRLLKNARDFSRLKSDVASLSGAKASAESRLKRVYSEIKDLGSALSEGLIKELDRRTALEARYVRFQKLKQRFEDTLRKLYAANDVSNLIDVVTDIKEIIGAEGISLYLIEENDALGRYLKPLVWDDEFLSQADFSRHIASLSSQDFAAFIARTGQELNLSDPQNDERFSGRYRDQLRRPLTSLLGAPLRDERSVVGVLEVYNKKAGDAKTEGFGADDQQMLKGLSEHISLALAKLNLIQYDALTGLLRPDPFLEKAIQKIEILSKRRQEIGGSAMVMGDVDWFKNYNDRNGHEAGNRLLRDLAGVLRASIRDEDLLCRYGGEEFLFLLSGVKNIEEATLLTERIRKAVEDHIFENEESQPRHNLTMSFGVTLLPRERTAAPGALTKAGLKKFAGEADMAMSEAKGKKLSALQADARMITKNKVCAYVREKASVMSKTTILRAAGERAFVEKRKFERYYTSTLCIFQEDGGHRVATTVDISLGGTRISSDNSFALTKRVEIFLVLGSRANPFRGEVIYCQKVSPHSAFFYTGLKFLDASPADRRVLETYFLSLGKENPRSF